MSEETTYIEPEYQRTRANHKPVDGVQFFSYSTGISRYARISEDGQIKTARNFEKSTFSAHVIGHGQIAGPGGKPKVFHTETAAAEAAVKVWRKMQETKK